MIEIFFPSSWTIIEAADVRNEHGALSLGKGRMAWQRNIPSGPESEFIYDMQLVWQIPWSPKATPERPSDESWDIDEVEDD